jgi:GT2 family glycosyltransferase
VVKAAFCIVNWNGRSLLPDCIASLRSQTFTGSPIIVVDNDSKDDSVAYLGGVHPDVTVLQLDWNSGFAHANNVAIRTAFRDPAVTHVALVNTDARLAPNWLETLLNEAARKPRAAMLQSLTLDHHDPSIIDSHHIFVARNLQATQAGNRQRHDQHFATERIFGVNAAAALYSRAFLEAQPFDEYLDEQLGMYLEDVDLAARAVVMGWEAWFVGGTHALHMGSASSKQRASDFSLFMTWRNQPGMLLANFPTRILLRALPSAVKADWQTINHLRRTGAADRVPAVVRGRLVGLWRARRFLAKRRALAPFVVVDHDILWQLMRTGKLLN